MISNMIRTFATKKLKTRAVHYLLAFFAIFANLRNTSQRCVRVTGVPQGACELLWDTQHLK